MTPTQLRDQLAGQAETLCRELLPMGKKVGHEWVVGSVAGEEGSSCKIQLTGPNRGKWKDFSSQEKGGDLIDLFAQTQGLNLSDAIKAAKKYLGITEPQFEGYKPRTYKKPEKPFTLAPLRDNDAAVQFLIDRGLQRAIKPYKIATADDGQTVVFPYLDAAGVLVHLSYRSVADKKFWTSKETRPSLFGWQAIPEKAREVVITEGQLDAMAMYVYGFPALSIPFGAGKGHHDWIAGEWDSLERFDTIYIAFDQDDAGKGAVGEVVDRLGRHRCRVVELPAKDANACLSGGIGADQIALRIREARALDPAELRSADGYLDEVYNEFYPKDPGNIGWAPPWPFLASQFQFRFGETTVIAGVNGHGKSEGVGHITLSAMAQGVRACVASLEFRPRKWLARIARQALCAFTPQPDRLSALHDWYADKLWVFDVVGTARMDKMLQVFLYAYRRYGVRLFVIDNMSKCGLAEDDYNGQKAFIEKATSFSVEHNIHIIIVAHMRKGEGSQDWTKGGKWSIKGSGAITDLVDNVIIWSRNKEKEDKMHGLKYPSADKQPEQTAIELAELMKQPDAGCELEKQRNGGGEEPRQNLWFNTESHQFLSHSGDKPHRYLS